MLQNRDVYEQLVFQSSDSENDIIRDISRTFPGHVFYQQRHGPGQRSLYNVLKAFSVGVACSFMGVLLCLFLIEQNRYSQSWFFFLLPCLVCEWHRVIKPLYFTTISSLPAYFLTAWLETGTEHDQHSLGTSLAGVWSWSRLRARHGVYHGFAFTVYGRGGCILVACRPDERSDSCAHGRPLQSGSFLAVAYFVMIHFDPAQHQRYSWAAHISCFCSHQCWIRF